jgi:hypothetical protein
MAQEGELKTDIVTVTTHILRQQQSHKEATGDLSVIYTHTDFVKLYINSLQVDHQCCS